MLRTWNTENINQVGPPAKRALGGGSTFRKALGEAGSGSENPPAASGKGALATGPKSNKQRPQRPPLGGRSENAPAAAATGKNGGLVANSKPKQRRALGDISNAGKGPTGGGSGNGSTLAGKKQPNAGLTFTVHSDARMSGSAALKGKAPPAGGGGGSGAATAGPKASVLGKETPRSVPKLGVHVEDVEVAMGRMGDEEDALVERRAEQRAAAKMANPFRNASRRKPRSREAPFPLFSNDTHGATSEHAMPRDAELPTSGVSAASDEALQGSIDRMVQDDFEGLMGLMTSGTQESAVVEDDDLDLDWLTMSVEELHYSPLSPLDDSLLAQEVELNFG